MRRLETPYPLYHASVVRRFSDMPAYFTARVLMIARPEGSVEVCVPLVDYFRACKRVSSTWQDDHVRAIGLLWDFCVVHEQLNWSPQQLLREFALTLLSGTLGFASGSVKSRLTWPAVSLQRARRLVWCIEAFALWLTSRSDNSSLAEKIGINCKLRSGDEFRVFLIWIRMRQLSVMQHLKRRPRAPRSMAFPKNAEVSAGKEMEAAKYFPPEHVERLLCEGYRRASHASEQNIFLRYNIRDMMMALLDGWGGLRRSEGLHLWTTDVVENPIEPGHALVVLNHPEEALAEYIDPISGKVQRTQRKNALKRLYGLEPRNVVMRGHYHVGWKGMALNNNHQSNVFWSDKQAAALFLVLYTGYMRFVRPEVMSRRRAMGGADHPFLLLSHAINAKTGLPGEPYSAKAYERNHEAAVRRIGLQHDKESGTTSHGLRHLFGQNLADIKVAPEMIREAMHHLSMFSQLVYTRPSAQKTSNALQLARKNAIEGSGVLRPMNRSTIDELVRLRNEVHFGGLV